MNKNSRHHKRAYKIRRILRDKKQPVKKVCKKEKNDNPSEDSKLLTDNRKNHIILCFRHTSKFLNAVSKSTPEKSSGTNRIKSLNGLIA